MQETLAERKRERLLTLTEVKMLHLPFSKLYCSSGKEKKREVSFIVLSCFSCVHRLSYHDSTILFLIGATLSIRPTIINIQKNDSACSQCLNIARISDASRPAGECFSTPLLFPFRGDERHPSRLHSGRCY